VNDHENPEETPKLVVGQCATRVRFQRRLDRRYERLLVLMGIIAAGDALEEVVRIGAVFGPVEYRLIMLIDSRVVGANAYTDPMPYWVECRSLNGVPGPVQDVGPLIVIRGKGQPVLDLKVQHGGLAIAADPIDD